MVKTVIVTGACGFMGRHAARLLAEHGYSVVGIGHGPWDVGERKVWGVSSWHESEITPEALKSCALAPHAIMHFAGGSSVPSSLKSPLRDFQRTVTTTANILEFVRTQSPETKVIYPSSASVYGIVDKVPISEDVHPAPISPYGVHKWLAETMVVSYARQYGFPVAVVRFFSIYGPGLRKQLLWDACQKIAKGDCTFMGTGDEVRDWLHVDDAVELMMLAMQNAGPECPIVNGGSGEGICVRDIVRAISKHLQISESLTGFSGAHRAGDPNCFVASIGRAKGWGWAPRHSWHDGLSGYIGWWLQETETSLVSSNIQRARSASVS